MLQTITFNGPRLINAAATFFRYESGTASGADESIRVRADGQDLGLYFPGDSVELPDERSTWEIVPTSPACAGVVRLGVGRVQSARLTGVVSVMDAGKQRTIANQAFMARGTTTVGPATIAAVQLFNPAGSNMRAVVEAISMQCSVSSTIYAAMVNVSRTTLASGVSKLGGGVNSVMLSQSASAASFNALSVMNKEIVQLICTANVALGWTFKEPVVLPPGWGLMVISDATASPTVTAFFEYFEEPNT